MKFLKKKKITTQQSEVTVITNSGDYKAKIKILTKAAS